MARRVRWGGLIFILIGLGLLCWPWLRGAPEQPAEPKKGQADEVAPRE